MRRSTAATIVSLEPRVRALGASRGLFSMRVDQVRWSSISRLLVLVGLAACSGAPKPEGDTAEQHAPTATASSPSSQKYELDVDGDQSTDELVLQRMAEPDGPGAYDSLKIVRSTGERYAVAGRWDPPAAVAFRMSENLVPSATFFVGRFPRAGTLIFLFGEDVSCCAQSLSVYRIGARGLESYFARPDFSLTAPIAAGARSIEGVDGLREVVGSSAPDAAYATSYHPIVVVALGEQALVDTAASVARTRAALGGFAGLSVRDDIQVVTRRDSTRYVWDSANRRPLP